MADVKEITEHCEHKLATFSLSAHTARTGSMDFPVIKKQQLKMGTVLGVGKYGTVYRGRLTLPRGGTVPVAVKKPENDPELLAKTSEEAGVLQELEGEAAVPRLYGLTADSPPCMVMELCPGERLEDCLGRGRVCACLLALVEVCGVVRRLHARGIAHGDIHEGNVLVDASGEGVRAFLLDFGLAARGADPGQQENDVIDIACTALQVIPDTERFSDLRQSLEDAPDLNEVTALLRQVLEEDDFKEKASKPSKDEAKNESKKQKKKKNKKGPFTSTKILAWCSALLLLKF
ncbi:uncharacterized protein LOC126990489 [Eriocheir sinensis]|uniref:uncharacterized protein LOC126990489 n=1 Tax=Eriocheir sinensis TaxID=95602 RepID=UPI0021C6CC61|nr:uncharacterized protein LOC126990489 [Eriocheir sinensis]